MMFVISTLESIPEIQGFVTLLIGIGGGIGIMYLFTNPKLKVLSGAFLGLIIINIAYTQLSPGIEFFPSTDTERVFIEVESPTGTNLEMSNRISKEIEKRLQPFYDTDVREIVSNVGMSNNIFGGGANNANVSTITVQFIDYDDRFQVSTKTTEQIREAITGIAGCEIEVKKQDEGPPVGKPINVEIIGDNFSVLGKIAEDIKKEINVIPGVVDLKDNYDAGRPEVRVEINREKAALFEMNTSLIANALRTAINGFEASKYRIDEEEYDITVRLREDQRDNIDVLKNLRINYNDMKGNTRSVPLISVADMEYDKGPGAINRIDLKRVVTVSGEVDAAYNDVEILNKVKAKIASMNLPPDYRISYTGQDEFQKESEDFLSKAFLIGFFGIFLILVIQFNSFTQPIMIMMAVAISLIGVFIGLIVFQMPFGIIMTGIGVISLAGVVVNNNIVLIDYINILRKRGQTAREAAINAGIRRFRPVTLTAMTTILGLIPLTFGFGF